MGLEDDLLKQENERAYFEALKKRQVRLTLRRRRLTCLTVMLIAPGTAWGQYIDPPYWVMALNAVVAGGLSYVITGDDGGLFSGAVYLGAGMGVLAFSLSYLEPVTLNPSTVVYAGLFYTALGAGLGVTFDILKK